MVTYLGVLHLEVPDVKIAHNTATSRAPDYVNVMTIMNGPGDVGVSRQGSVKRGQSHRVTLCDAWKSVSKILPLSRRAIVEPVTPRAPDHVDIILYNSFDTARDPMALLKR
jgi:hypothetical protein